VKEHPKYIKELKPVKTAKAAPKVKKADAGMFEENEEEAGD